MQLIANMLYTASSILLVALGFALIYRVVRFFHFAHAASIALGAYAAHVFSNALGLPWVLVVPLASLVTVALLYSLERLVYRPLRRAGASALVQLLASLGAYIVLQNVVSILFGDDTKLLPIQSGGLAILGARLSRAQLWTILAAFASVVFVPLWLQRTRSGKVMQAVASHPELAATIGIDPNLVIAYAMAAGTALGAVAGILLALDVGMTPTMGMRALMVGVVAAVVGSPDSVRGIAAASILVAGSQHAAAWTLGTQWQDTAAFAVLLLFLLGRTLLNGHSWKKWIVPRGARAGLAGN